MPFVDTKGLIREFHAHIYYTPEMRGLASSLREALSEVVGGRLKIYTLSDGPRGPHGAPMFGVDIQASDLPEVLAFIMINHGPLPVLLHPVTDHEILDHSHHAFWLGAPQPLNLAVLR